MVGLPTGRRVKLLDDPDQLLADAQSGEPDWLAIYRVVRKPMYGAVWRVLRPHQSYGGQCDDDIVMRAFEQLRACKLHGVKSLVCVARVIAYRRALDVVARPSKEVLYATFEDTAGTEVLAEELQRREQLFEGAKNCLEKLPDRQRLAVKETIMKRRAVQEVAENDLGGVSTQAVYKLRLKAIENIRRCLEKHRLLHDNDPGEGRTL